MKKILVALLVALMALMVTVALADETHVHDMQVIDDEPATCTAPGAHVEKCSQCPYETIVTKPALGHDWDKWEADTSWATADQCTKAGKEARFCKVCYEKETREAAAKGHDYSAWSLNVAPTCTTKGQEVRWCKRCLNDAVTERRDVATLPHEMTKWLVHAEPTCTVPGMNYRYCTKCNGEWEYAEVDAKGHSFVEGSETVNSKGEKIAYCTVCLSYVKVADAPAAKPEVKPEDKPEQKPSKPATKPSTPNKPTTNKDGVTIPATGETMNVAPFIMMLVAIVGLAVTKQKVTE